MDNNYSPPMIREYESNAFGHLTLPQRTLLCCSRRAESLWYRWITTREVHFLLWTDTRKSADIIANVTYNGDIFDTIQIHLKPYISTHHTRFKDHGYLNANILFDACLLQGLFMPLPACILNKSFWWDSPFIHKSVSVKWNNGFFVSVP